MSDYIEFKKQRELGEILSDTFAFIRTQFKPFFSIFLKIVGPYILIMIISLGLYMYYVGDSVNSMLIQSSPNEAASFATMFIIGILYVVSLIVVYVMSQSTVLHYIKSYANGKGQTNLEEIKAEVYSRFVSFMGLGFLVVLCVFVGLMFCIIPGIYLYVPLSLSFCILVFNQKDATDSFSYSFTLIKDEWWITFATLFVIGIIVTIASYAFALPTVIYQYAKMGILSGEVDAENMMDVFKDPIYILLNIVGTVAQFLLNVITVIAAAFIYFNLNEKKNFTGTYERIQNLGQETD